MRSVFRTLMLLLTIALACGCENSSVVDGIAISPSGVALEEGQSQVFKVSGGHGSYTWSLIPNDGRATLNPSSGDTVVFTLNSATAPDASNAWSSITVRCVAIIPGVSYDTGTNNPATINGYTYVADAAVSFKVH